jgi:hypothetical protein
MTEPVSGGRPLVASRAPIALRFARNLLIAAAGLCAGALALRSLGPATTLFTLERARVAADREHCQVMFVGPSYVAAQIEPAEFDAEAKRLGRRVRSCKFGGTGMRGPELHVHLEELLALGWPRLELVVIDVTLGPTPRLDKGNWFQPRTIQWHTLASVRWMAGFYARQADPVERSVIAAHLKHVGANYLNLGNGLEKASLLAITQRARAAFGLPSELPVLKAVSDYERHQRKRIRAKKSQAKAYLKANSPEKHARRVKQLIKEKKRVRAENQLADGEFPRVLRELVRAHGHDAVFIHAPVWRALPARAKQRSGSEPITLLDFNDPVGFAELYEPRNRGRNHHLSWYGALAYSRALARELARSGRLP